MALSEARRFALALAAIPTEARCASHVDLGGWPRGADGAARAARALREDWEIASADALTQMLTWLYEEGHSKQYAEIEKVAAGLAPGIDVKTVYLSHEDAKTGKPPVWTEFHQKLEVVVWYRDRFRERRLLAWDMGRLVAIAGWGALAGFVSEDDAWTWCMRAARRAQEAYASWRELGEHYVLGLGYWRPDRVGQAPATVERLLADPASPWSAIDWRTDLSAERGAEGPSVFVKVSKCHACGAWKAKKAKTAYVYCDHCASLIDWDFELALTTPGSAMPGPKYEELREALKPELDAALAAGDRARYAAAQGALYDAYVEACPASLPPRMADPGYRARFVAYTVNTTVEQDFDEACRFLTHQMEKATARLAWDQSDPAKPRVTSASFWELFRAVKARADAGLLLNVKSGNVKAHPDGAPPDLLARMGMSLFVQGWLPYLAPSDGARLLDETRLRGDYQQLPLPPTSARHCGGCGAALDVIDGAVRVLCDACGRQVDVDAAEMTCGQCGGPLSVPFGADRFPCPYCRCEVRAMRVPMVVPASEEDGVFTRTSRRASPSR